MGSCVCVWMECVRVQCARIERLGGAYRESFVQSWCGVGS